MADPRCFTHRPSGLSIGGMFVQALSLSPQVQRDRSVTPTPKRCTSTVRSLASGRGLRSGGHASHGEGRRCEILTNTTASSPRWSKKPSNVGPLASAGLVVGAFVRLVQVLFSLTLFYFESFDLFNEALEHPVVVV